MSLVSKQMQAISAASLCHPRAEGKAMHPDDILADLTGGQYLNQLRAYAEWRGVEQTKREYCSKPEMLKQL